MKLSAIIIFFLVLFFVTCVYAITPPDGATDYMVYGTTSATTIKWYGSDGVNISPDSCFKNSGGTCVNFGTNFVFYGRLQEETSSVSDNVFYGILGVVCAGMFWFAIVKHI